MPSHDNSRAVSELHTDEHLLSRAFPAPSHAHRTPFQRDRERIVRDFKSDDTFIITRSDVMKALS